MKTLLSIALALTLSVAHAQRLIGVYGGVNVNSISNKNGGVENYASLQSFHIGFMANIPISIFSFQTGLQFTGKGGLVTLGDRESPADYFIAETNPFYLEVPASFNLNLRFEESSGLYIGAGPYVAIGIGGTNRAYGRHQGIEFGYIEKISFDDIKDTPPEQGGAYSSMHRYDFGARFNAGVFLSRLHIGAYYDQSMTPFNRISNPDQNDALQFGTIGFSAGFVFSGQ